MIRPANKFDQVISRIHIHSQSVAQIGIEIRETRAVHNQIERLLQARLRLGIHAESRLADVAFDNVDFLFQKRAKLATVFLLQRIECWRLLENFLKSPLARSRPIAPDQ